MFIKKEGVSKNSSDLFYFILLTFMECPQEQRVSPTPCVHKTHMEVQQVTRQVQGWENFLSLFLIIKAVNSKGSGS